MWIVFLKMLASSNEFALNLKTCLYPYGEAAGRELLYVYDTWYHICKQSLFYC